MILLIGAAALAGLYFMTQKKSVTSEGDLVDESSTSKPEVKKEKVLLYDLQDVYPDDQGGNYKRDYDIYFESASEEFGVPFALLKAHAIAESSLKPNAFLDENPTKRPDRIGWASRGLMQILWSPLEPAKGDAGINRERWAKYGYSASDLGIDGIRQFEPNVNVRIAAQLMRDNLNSAKGNIRDTINMYNTGKKESVFPAPNGYTDKVYGYYKKLLGVS